MVKKTKESVGPNIVDVLELLGLIPPTELGKLLFANKHCQRPQLSKEAVIKAAPNSKPMTLEEAARILKCPVNRIKKILKAVKAEPKSIPEVQF